MMEKHNQLPTRPQITYAKSNAKVLVSNGKNFYRANPDPPEYYHEKPMTLNAWTQTTNDDFEYLIDEQQQHMKQQQKHIVAQQNENELKLLEKIRVLEENLRVHSELLSQIHATSGGRFSQTQQKQAQHQQQPLQQQPQNSHVQSNKPQYSQQQQNQQQTSQQQPSRLTKQHQQHQSYSPSETRHKIASPNATSLINQFQQGPKESIKYTIIAEGDSHGNDNGEPIEIQLAEEDGAINLNSSADSGRLEIYIDDENVDVKHEALPAEDEQSQRQQMSTVTIQATTTNSAPSSNNPQLVKRRKLDSPTPTMNGTFANAQTINKSNSYSHTPIASVPNIKTSPNMALPTKKKVLTDSLKTEKFSREESLLKTNQGNVMVSLGPNNTLIPEEVFESIPWKSASIATRRLLMTIFDRNTLATHSMTGKPSPAFKDQNKPLKKMLDRAKIEDILFAVTMKCGVSEKEVRNAITTKCADENKMMKLQMGKSHVLGVSNKENMG